MTVNRNLCLIRIAEGINIIVGIKIFSILTSLSFLRSHLCFFEL